MKNKRIVVRVLAIAGTVLIWLPVVAPLAFGVLHLVRAGKLLVDYLMPAELFFVVLAGGVLLIAAALLAHSYARLIIAGLVGGVVMLGAAMGLAEASGLASGAIEPEGIWWLLTLTGIVLYIAGIVVAGVGGILLLRRLFGAQPMGASSVR